ncbi:hypothetical protein [Natronorubrum bangense]|uniref:DUF7978 domain-containing protein n=2 Tax=Natronorubrum bangense TaxID=61858 RepID=L9WM05_9EURY|nr:hypothetical protein [Natronorubrum bangense]ELY50266.1 hypothetical protein C494_05653 [Natronorubrum bangense JCM 10635]QCC54288.1 hypothetical protein DV706_07180 [Natronorubrum bangense]
MADNSQLEYDDDEQADEQPTQRVATGQDADLPFKQGAVFGAIAVVLSYFAHLFSTIVSTAQTTPATYTDDGSLVVTEMVASWEAAGWSYLAAFGTGFEAEGEPATLGDAPNHAAAAASPPFFLIDTALFLLTAGLVVGAGYAIATYVDADDAVGAVKASVTVVPVYLVFAVLAAFLMTTTYSDPALVSSVFDSVGALEAESFLNDSGEVTGEITFGPATMSAILLAGLVVPAVLAAIGGVLTQRQDALETLMTKATDR